MPTHTIRTDFTATSGIVCVLTITIRNLQVAIDAAWKGPSTEQDRKELEAYVARELDAPLTFTKVVEDDETRAKVMSDFLSRRQP